MKDAAEIRATVDKLRLAACDPDSPIYGSDLVPWIDDLTTAWLAEHDDPELDDCDWYVVDHERNDERLRGPFKNAETAGAIRSYMESGRPNASWNLWVIPRKRATP